MGRESQDKGELWERRECVEAETEVTAGGERLKVQVRFEKASWQEPVTSAIAASSPSIHPGLSWGVQLALGWGLLLLF